MNKDEISKQLRELFKDKKCNFYKVSIRRNAPFTL